MQNLVMGRTVRGGRGSSSAPVVTLALCALIAFPAVADSRSAEDESVPAKTEDVVVIAPRLDIPLRENPAATTVVSEGTLEKSRTKSIGAEEALKLVPGVKVDNQADGERVHLSIRGQGLLTERGVRGIKVLLDGLPLNDPTGFAPDLFDVDWATVRRVEVFRGPASALYGGGASGGILNIVTRDGGQERDRADASIDVGSQGFWKAFGETGGRSGDVSYRVSGSRMTGNGYRDHTAYFGTNLYGKFSLQSGPRTRFTLIAAGTSYFNENAEGLNVAWLDQDRTMANPDALTFNERQKTRRGTVGLTGQTALAEDQDLSFSVYYRHTMWEEAVPSTVQHRTFDSPGAFLQYTVRFRTGSLEHSVSLGSDLDGQSIDDLKRPNLGGAREAATVVADQRIRQSGFGVFGLDRIGLGPKWGTMLGVRWDRITNELTDDLKADDLDLSGDADFEKATGRVGLTYNPAKDLGFYASWGQGFLPPATEELANNPARQGGFNQGLGAATSNGEEVGVRGSLGSTFTYDLALFHLRTANDFGRYRVPARPLETFYGNLGSTRRYGVEALLGWLPAPGVDVQLAYTYNDFRYTKVRSLFGDFSDAFMPNSPRHKAYLDVAWNPVPTLVVGLAGELETRAYVDQTNSYWSGGYTLLHARAGYRFEVAGTRAELLVAVKNITDKEYNAFTEPDPDGNSFQPAAKRQLFAGLHVWLDGN